MIKFLDTVFWFLILIGLASAFFAPFGVAILYIAVILPLILLTTTH